MGVSMPADHHALLRELANLIPGAKTRSLTDEVGGDKKQRAQTALLEQAAASRSSCLANVSVERA